MRTLEILLEENAFGSARPIQVVADVPVSSLVPVLVEELKLPETDLFGKKLIYRLRQAASMRILPEDTTLMASGIQPGTRMALDSYLSDVSAHSVELFQASVPLLSSPAGLSMHSASTLSDASSWQVGPISPGMYVGSASPGWQAGATNVPVVKKKSSRTRRAFLVTAGLALGMGVAGVGYAAYHNPLKDMLKGVMNSPNAAPVRPVVTQAKAPTATATMAGMPTRAVSMLSFTMHQQTIRTVAWSPDGKKLVSGADDAHVFVWGLDGAVQQDIVQPAAVRALAWSPDAMRVAIGAGTQVAFFNALTGANLARFGQAHQQTVTSLAWTAQQQMQVVSGGVDKQAIVWDTNQYRPLVTYKRHTASIEDVSWSANGQTIATSSLGGFVRVWQAANGQDLHGYYQDAALPMRAMAFSPVGEMLAVGGDDGILRFWNGLACGNNGDHCMDVPMRVQAAKQAIDAIVWSRDGRFLAVGSDDGTFSLWAPGQSQTPLFTVQQNAAVRSIAWSPDGKQLATASGTTVTLWTLQ